MPARLQSSVGFVSSEGQFVLRAMRKPLLLSWAFCLLIAARVDTGRAFNYDNDLTFDEPQALAEPQNTDSLVGRVYNGVTQTLSRVKRDIFDWFNIHDDDKKEEVTTSTSNPVTEPDDFENGRTSPLFRTTRDADRDTDDDEDPTYDLSKGGSGDVGSGEEHLPTPETKRHRHSKSIVRVTFYMREWWQDKLEDKSSTKYLELKSDLEESMNQLLSKITGTQTAHLVNLEKWNENDVVRVTMDVFSQYNDKVEDEVETQLKAQIKETNKLGNQVIELSNKHTVIAKLFEDQSQVECENGVLCGGVPPKCLPIGNRCDGITQCDDGSDEEGCPVFGHETTFNQPKCRADDVRRCDDGQQSICHDQLCDGRIDCDDGSDEDNCDTPSTPRPGSCDGFLCESNGDCLPHHLVCDRTFDCPDGADERNCTRPETCNHHTEWTCNDGTCVGKEKYCNGVPDCPDYSDEEHCIECPQKFQCVVGSQKMCIDWEYYCNGDLDCTDMTDEKYCFGRNCDGHFRCVSTGVCLHRKKVCDRISDCEDDSDERNCKACTKDQFRCPDGQCIPSYRACDKVPDCSNGEDEANCVECKSTEFRCNNEVCIPYYMRCNRNDDCGDNSDEYDCPTTPRPKLFDCPDNSFTCHSGNECVSQSVVCDGSDNCQDGSDELECGSVNNCRQDEFACSSGDQCVPTRFICNKFYDCHDRSDEENCAGTPQVQLMIEPKELSLKQSEEVVFQCRDVGLGRQKVHWVRGNGKEMPKDARLHGHRLEIPNVQPGDAGIYTCEAYDVPPHTPGARKNAFLRVTPYVAPTMPPLPYCKLDEAPCKNRQCIKKSQICDGRPNCLDGSDEYRCSHGHVCQPNERECGSTSQCIMKNWFCDGQTDCLDGSDERDCNLGPSGPNGTCYSTEFTCPNGLCIPSAFRCDQRPDCKDGSDEYGCYLSTFVDPKLPGSVSVPEGDTLVLHCTATGVPTPYISWRFNWNAVPSKCRETSVDGHGTLTCPDMREEDQGSYSCEALQKLFVLYPIDARVVVVPRKKFTCQRGTFNDLATRQEECISCFCFGQATECTSANLYVSHLTSPRFYNRVVPVKKVGEAYEINLLEGSSVQQYIKPYFEGLFISAPDSGRDSEGVYQYFALPDSHHSNQLNSYGGYIKYRLTTSHNSNWKPLLDIPDVIIQGNGKLLLSLSFLTSASNQIEQDVSVRIFENEWNVVEANGYPKRASRADIMMVLENVENVLIRLQYFEGPDITTSLTNVHMDSAGNRNNGLGKAAFVEKCSCPHGYQGQSCEKCSAGFRRVLGNYLGICTTQSCPPGTYGAPDRHIPCQPCPCPLTHSSNQFGATCRLDSDDKVTCDCLEGYVGRRCERCDYGYTGNPLVSGSYCRKEDQCDPAGSLSTTPDPYSGKCHCKDFVTGSRCDQCQANSFHLSPSNPTGCTMCFCMGISKECHASNLYKDEIYFNFMGSDYGFKLASVDNPTEMVDPTLEHGQLVFDRFNQEIYYWVLPSIFLNNKVTSYNGKLSYKISYTPIPGGQSSKNNAADVLLNSANKIKLYHYSPQRFNHSTEVTVTIPLEESAWQRDDGGEVNRETFLMALSDIQSIYIKATYTTHTLRAALLSISMSTATSRNTGRETVQGVEQCVCPEGYVGTSCEDCAPGFTRSEEGVYLGVCELCKCNGYSDDCNPETGECLGCRDNRDGPRCENCARGYRMEQGRCVRDYPDVCSCDPRGSVLSDCVDGRCMCKTNVVGSQCNECKNGTYGLSEHNEYGCLECYCFGQTSDCRSSGYSYLPIPITILSADHGFTLTDGRGGRSGEELVHNFHKSEVGFKVSDPHDKRYWSLPSDVTGDQVLSYGGELTFTLSFTDRTSYESVHHGDRAVMLTGNGVTVFKNLDLELYPDERKSVSVKLVERDFMMLNPRSGVKPVSKHQMLQILSSVEAILVQAVVGPTTEYSYISDVTLERAERSGGRPALEVEVCRCPPGHEGTSCQKCIDGYYKDNYHRCQPCLCQNGGQCQIRSNYQFVCNCPDEWTGPTCETRVSSTVSLSLSPAGFIVEPIGTRVTFHCEFTGTLSVYPVLNEVYVNGTYDGYSRSGPHQLRELTTEGRKSLTVTVTRRLSEIACTLFNKNHKAIANARSYVTAVDDRRPPVPPPEPQITLNIVEYPPNKTVEVGDQITLVCTGSSRESNVRIKWSKDGGSLPHGRHRQADDGSLQIWDVNESDSGIYVCTGHDNMSSHTITITITVVPRPGGELPPLISIEPDYIEVMENELIELQCTARRGSKASIDWRRYDASDRQVAMNPEVEITDGLLRIPNTRKEDEGKYECVARNYGGVSSEHIFVRVRGLAVNDTNSINIVPEEVTAGSGSTIIIQCRVSNNDDGSIELVWKRDRVPLAPNQVTSSNYSSTQLTLYDVTPADSGIYFCTGFRRSTGNKIGQGRAFITITDAPVPRVAIRPETLTVNVGEDIRLECTGDGSAYLSWRKSGGSLPEHRVKFLNRNRTLYVPNAERSDTGIYVCNANLYGSESSGTAVVQVQHTIPPEVSLMPSGLVELNPQSYHQVDCRATGFPTPSVYWVRENNEQLPSNFHDNNGRLRIEGMTSHNVGRYVCIAENEAGRATGTVVLSLRGKPVVTMNHDGFVRLSVGERFELICTAEGYPEPSVFLTKGSEQTYNARPNLGQATYSVISVTKDDEDDYTCVARNSLGEDRKTVRVYVEGSAPRPGGDQSPLNPDYEPRGGKTHVLYEGTTNNFTCNFQAGLEDSIEWVRNDGLPLPSNVRQRNGELVITQIQPENEGYYTCQLKNRKGFLLQQMTLKIVVKHLKGVRLTPETQVVSIGDNAHIECKMEDEPDARIEWKGVNRDLPENRAHVSGHTIWFRDMQEEDAGEYVCIAETDNFSAEGKARVVVKGENERHIPIISVVGDPVRYVTEGGSVTVQCTANRHGEHIFWTREQEQMPDNAVTKGNTLRIDNIRLEDAGNYLCSVMMPNDYKTGWKTVTIHVRSAVAPMLRIEPSIDVVRVGGEIDLICKTTGRIKDQPQWEILDGSEEARESMTILGRTLRISKVHPMHAGRYRCHAKTQAGYDIEDVYTLVVQDNEMQKAAKVKRAAVGETVELECDQGLEPPTTYTWIKGQGKPMPNAKNHTLRLEKVTHEDAGEYVCIASNNAIKIDFPTFLIVKGTIPRFDKSSYIQLRSFSSFAYLKTDLFFMVKPEHPDGMFLYTSDLKARDFFSVGLKDGRVECRFDVGSGEAILQSNTILPLHEWSNITIKREKKEGKLWVNGRGPVVGTSQGRFQGLDLTAPVYLGSVPSFDSLKPNTGFTEGFKGCISQFRMGDVVESIAEKDSLEWHNVKECETCSEDLCQNNGACQEEPNYRGYKCMCPRGYTGANCERVGTTCYEGLCGDGVCENLDWSFRCHCRLGSYGEHCEHKVTVTVPHFKTHSHLAYAVPVSGGKFSFDMEIKPETLNDAILMYAVGHEPSKEYAVIVMKDGYLHFIFVNKHSPLELVSRTRVRPGVWTRVSVQKKDNFLSLTTTDDNVNLDLNNFDPMTLKTLYVGGYDSLKMKPDRHVGVYDGFDGCIRLIKLNERHLNLKSFVGSNVHQCQGETPGRHLKQVIGEQLCPIKPCRNGGICNTQNNRQFCVCNEYFQGDYCEMETPCKMDHLCKPHGECKTHNDGDPNSPGFKCHCHFGYKGKYCNEVIHIETSAEFDKNSYIELPESYLPSTYEEKAVSFMMQTSSPRGLIFWQGRDQHTRELEYLSIAVERGHVEVMAHEQTDQMKLISLHRVDDDRPHNVSVLYVPGELQLSVDGETEATASTTTERDNDFLGNVFIGGMPDIEFKTGGKFEVGFQGCIAAFKLNRKPPVNFQVAQVDARNVKPCSSDLLSVYYNSIN
ncbi:basement membrane-specific heparan sulfate proteoglycan core protein isoform X3 [Cimex lectularius]|uniref:Basement membrane-specific heparan sulfate proteoglycan core protein n=1 Tax=Cimex lectularius TaxID=79782 RepID=A0A8I6SDW8_CIMLE|nr:basement membrane-specific heparan sulfate proteoglycan core protein isoform X3 [Cimex lectularius]